MDFTTFKAASFISEAGIIDSLDLANISLASSEFVPSSLTTTGTSSPSSLTASTTPFATLSHLTIPPKMLIRIAFTLSSESMILNPFLKFFHIPQQME